MADISESFPILTILCAIDSEVIARSFTYISEKVEQGKNFL